MKKYMIVAPLNESFYEVYEEEGEYCGDFVCRCDSFEYAKKICDALEGRPKKEEEYVLTLGQLLFDLEEPDHTPIEVDAMKLEVVFDTADRLGLALLSCYVSETDGKVHIDIGTGEE